MKSKDIVLQMKSVQQQVIDIETDKMKILEGLDAAIAEDILAAENAILESAGQANGDDKIYSDKEWNDRELEIKTAMEEKDTKLAELGSRIDALIAERDASIPQVQEAHDRADKAEKALAAAKERYEKQQAEESAAEAAVFSEPSVSEQPSQLPPPETSQA